MRFLRRTVDDDTLQRDALALVITRLDADTDGAMAILDNYTTGSASARLLICLLDVTAGVISETYGSADQARAALRRVLQS